MKIEQPFDGHNTYGYPYTFHKVYSLECGPCPENPSETNFLYLLTDIGFALLIAVVLYYIIKLIFRKKTI